MSKRNSRIRISTGDCVRNFHDALREKVMETCLRCKERWFEMKLNAEQVCYRCRRVDKEVAHGDDQVFLYSSANNMDPGSLPSLSDLTEIEEMLIARVHAAVQVRQVHGQQYKYSGHVVNFMRNTGRVYNSLPLLPQDLAFGFSSLWQKALLPNCAGLSASTLPTTFHITTSDYCTR